MRGIPEDRIRQLFLPLAAAQTMLFVRVGLDETITLFNASLYFSKCGCTAIELQPDSCTHVLAIKSRIMEMLWQESQDAAMDR